MATIKGNVDVSFSLDGEEWTPIETLQERLTKEIVITREKESVFCWMKRIIGESQGHIEYYIGEFLYWLKYKAWWL